MTGSTTNPFALPGFAPMGDASQNPMMASMEMMRHAWQSLASAGAGSLTGGSMVAPPMSLEELDRRINELRTVENWLRMNLSMLSSTIQGMEVQRATIATIKSFVSPSESGHADAPSALEVALGLKPSGQARIKPASEAPVAAKPASTPDASPSSSSSTFATSAAPAEGGGKTGSAQPGAGLPGAGSAEAWWGMLQQQFDSLASATAASLKQAESVVNAAGNVASTASKSAVSTASSVSSGLGKAVSAAVSGTAPEKPVAPKKTASSRATKKTAGAAASSRGTEPGKAGTTRAPRKRTAAPKASS